ncbi:MAG: DNA repair protein RecO [Candidatus Dormibacteria bacterium]
MTPTYPAEALVLRRVDYGDADRILTLFTREHGRVSVMAKGIRRPRSHTGAGLDLFAHVRVQLAPGRNLEVVTQAVAASDTSTVSGDTGRLGAASVVAEAVLRVLEEGAPNEDLFEAVLQALHAIGLAEDTQRQLDWFIARLLDLLGYRPEVGRCTACAGPLPEQESSFSPAAGGALCLACASTDASAWRLPPGSLKVLRVLVGGDTELYPRLRLDLAVRRDVRRAMRGQLEYHLDGRLRSFDFLAEMANQTGG